MSKSISVLNFTSFFVIIAKFIYVSSFSSGYFKALTYIESQQDWFISLSGWLLIGSFGGSLLLFLRILECCVSDCSDGHSVHLSMSRECVCVCACLRPRLTGSKIG